MDATWAALVGAGAAILGSVIGTTGVLVGERLRYRREDRDEHVARLIEFSTAAQVWGTLVVGYPAKSKSRSPLAIAAHNFDLRLTQRVWLQQFFHANELLWRAATAAIAGSTETERRAVTDVLEAASEFEVGGEIPDQWSRAVTHIAYLAGEAKYGHRE